MQRDLKYLQNTSHIPAVHHLHPSRSPFHTAPEEHSKYASEDHFPASPLEDLKYKHDVLSSFCCKAQGELTCQTLVKQTAVIVPQGTSLEVFTEEGMQNVNRYFCFLGSKSLHPTSYILLHLPCAILRKRLLFTVFWNCIELPWKQSIGCVLQNYTLYAKKVEAAEIPDITAHYTPCKFCLTYPHIIVTMSKPQIIQIWKPKQMEHIFLCTESSQKIRHVEEKKIRMILINTGQFPSYRCHSKEEWECRLSEPLLKKQFYLLRPTWLGLEDLHRAKTMHERDTRDIRH